MRDELNKALKDYLKAVEKHNKKATDPEEDGDNRVEPSLRGLSWYLDQGEISESFGDTSVLDEE